MTDPGARLANNLWHATCYYGWWRFQHASRQIQASQEQILTRYLQQNKDTVYGKRFGFASISSTRQYQRVVPLTTYDDYAEEIRAMYDGKPNVLTTSPVRMFEMSSGSTAASKLVPYTAALRAEFQRGIASWVYSLFREFPRLKDGKAYWSVTPLVDGKRYTPGGVPIGFEEDSEYLALFTRRLAELFLAVPNQVKHITQVDSFRYTTLLFLLHQPNLRIISVWNPTYLSLILSSLAEWWSRLLEDLAHGTLTPPQQLSSELHRILSVALTASPVRARELAALPIPDVAAIWPNLGLVSCWMDGAARSHARELQKQLPHVSFQAKGLIATEAFVSFPLPNTPAAVLATHSHFFEFLPVRPSTQEVLREEPKLAHELREGEEYEVVVTTGGGFYRYRLQDVARVVAHLRGVPCLQFLGKTDNISDWFGEKLNERFVARVLAALFDQHQISPRFAMLAPNDTDSGFRYTLYIELPSELQTYEKANSLCMDLDQMLCDNFHYGYARRLRQLSCASVCFITQAGNRTYLSVCASRGQRIGNIKTSVLDKNSGWHNHFHLSDVISPLHE